MWRATRGDIVYAVKIFKRSDTELTDSSLEAYAHDVCGRHEHLSTLLDVGWFASQSGRLGLVFEHVGRDLRQCLLEKRFPVEDGRAGLWQLLLAASYLHSSGLLHADIKPSNILVASVSRAAGQVASAEEVIAAASRQRPVHFKLADLGNVLQAASADRPIHSSTHVINH